MTSNQSPQQAALDDFHSKLLSVTQGNDDDAISPVLDASSPPCTGYTCRPMEQGFLFIRLGVPAINQLIKPFADSFFPASSNTSTSMQTSSWLKPLKLVRAAIGLIGASRPQRGSKAST